MKNRHKTRARRLQFEPMEDRRMMAGLAAYLNNGVLTVNGSAGSDVVNFRQAGGWLAIDGVYNAWQTSNVSLIIVNLGGGNDSVAMNALTENLVVNAGGGSDAIKFANGQQTAFGGGDQALVWNGNFAKVNGTTVYDQRDPSPAPDPGPAPAPDPAPAPNNPGSTSGLAAKLYNGVLTITATDDANFINVKEAGGWLAVDGIHNAWTTSQVNRIDILLRGGNDTVYLNGSTRNFVIMSSGGTKQVRFGNGDSINYSSTQLLCVWNGAYAKLGDQVVYDQRAPAPAPPAPTPDPDPTPPPTPSNWFTANIVDEALKTLGGDLYADSVISRSDILALFDSAEDGGLVDATELADLRKIASTTTLFAGAEHLWKLATYVVTNQTANAYYAGASLGSLAAGSSAGHLQNLVNKWFLGLDRPVANGTYRQFAGQLFVNGATYADVKQGNVGDCYFVMSLAEAAQQNASIINSMFIVNGDGTYTVKFYNGSTSYYVTVDAYLPTNGSGQAIYAGLGMVYTNTGNELWVSLAEKAYVQLNQFGFTRGGLTDSGQNSYNAISGGYIYAALGHITGQATTPFTSTSSSNSFTAFVDAYSAGKMIGFASKATTPAGSGVVGGHAYSVVSYNAATQQVTLFNPWGTQYGLLTLTWSQIQASFQYFDRTA